MSIAWSILGVVVFIFSLVIGTFVIADSMTELENGEARHV